MRWVTRFAWLSLAVEFSVSIRLRPALGRVWTVVKCSTERPSYLVAAKNLGHSVGKEDFCAAAVLAWKVVAAARAVLELHALRTTTARFSYYGGVTHPELVSAPGVGGRTRSW
jgi:hypothetical protein